MAPQLDLVKSSTLLIVKSDSFEQTAGYTNTAQHNTQSYQQRLTNVRIAAFNQGSWSTLEIDARTLTAIARREATTDTDRYTGVSVRSLLWGVYSTVTSSHTPHTHDYDHTHCNYTMPRSRYHHTRTRMQSSTTTTHQYLQHI